MSILATTPPGPRPAHPFPPCPEWCPGDHKGDETEVLDNGVVVTADRLHEKILTAFVAQDADAHEDHPRPVTVRVLVERYDTAVDAHLVDEPIRTRVLVEFVQEIDGRTRIIRAAIGATDLRALSVAAFHGAFWLDDAAVSE